MGNYLGGGSGQGGSYKKSELLLKQDGALFEIWKGVEVDASGQEKPVTIFYFDGAQATPEKVALVKNAINRTKLIRIPETITFKNAEEVSGALVFVTEYVEPLSKRLPELSVDEKIAGLLNIVKALDFVHTKVNPVMEHKNVNINSIFVNPTDSTDWKLGGFELSAPATGNVGASDVKQLADLIEQLGITKSLDHQYDLPSFISSAKSASPQSCATFLKSNFFKENSFVGIISHLRDMMSKSNQENIQFFQTLQSKLSQVPRDRLVSNILPRLKKFHVLVEPSAQEFLPSFFSIVGQEADANVTGLWTTEEFRKHIADFVAWTFSQTSPELKIVMLRNIKYCLHTFNAKSLSDILAELSNAIVTSKHNEFVDEAVGALCAILAHVAHTSVNIEPREVIRQTHVAVLTCAKDYPDDDIKANIILRVNELVDNTWPEDKLVDVFFASANNRAERVRQAGALLSINLIKATRGETIVKLYPNVARSLAYLMIEKEKSVREIAYNSLLQTAHYLMEFQGHDAQAHSSAVSTDRLSLKKVDAAVKARSSVSSSPRVSAGFEKPVMPSANNSRTSPQPVLAKETPKATSAGWGDFGGFDDEDFDTKKDNNETTLPDQSFETQHSLVTSTPTKTHNYDDILAVSAPAKQEKKPEVEEEDEFSMFGLAPKIKAAPTLIVEKPTSPPVAQKKIVVEEPIAPSTRLHGLSVTDDTDAELGESAWDMDDSMLEIDLPPPSSAPEQSTNNTNTTVPEVTPIVAQEPTTVEPTESAAESTPAVVEPEPTRVTATEEQSQTVEQSVSEPVDQSSPVQSVPETASVAAKEPRAAKGRKPEGGAAKKKASKKPEVAKVQLNFDFDDE